MKYTFVASARAELREAVDFYNRRQSRLGEEFFEEFEETISRILQRPASWKRLAENIYRCRLERFPYFLIYERKPDRIRICGSGPLPPSPELLAKPADPLSRLR